MTRALPVGWTRVDPALLAAYNRGIERANSVNRLEQALREGWCRLCPRDIEGIGRHGICARCRKRESRKQQ